MHNSEISPQLAESSFPPGFRLKRLEILNWGTFNGKIDILAPEGGWTLLVGDNGSGKSTAVDALRTLLVPPRLLQGSYNDAARDMTAKRKSDRSKRSYVRGAWTTASREESASGETQYLRGVGVQSILLAVFEDRCRGRSVSLGQVLWESNEKVEEIYAVADSAKNIRDHMAGSDDIREIRRKLKTNGFVTPGSYSAYSEVFRGLLDIESETAMEVFNQAIGVKEVEDLNKFIRQHMLEANDAVQFIKGTLRPHLTQLDECHKAIEDAEGQIESLTPVAELHSRMLSAQEEREHLQDLFDRTPDFFDWKLHELLLQHIATEKEEVNHLDSEKLSLETQQSFAVGERENLASALARDATEVRIQALEFQIREHRRLADERLSKHRQANQCLQLLNEISPLESDEQFKAAQERVNFGRARIDSKRNATRQEAIGLETDRRAALLKSQSLGVEINHLKAQQSSIPSEFVALRKSLCEATQLRPDDLPFVGELVQVKDMYADWTGIIERLLHGFGISLLVPERCYPVVSSYVNGRRIVDPRNPRRGLRLEFNRISFIPAPPALTSDEQKFVFGRLEFQPDHQLSSWVAKTAANRFRYVCCDSIEQFQREIRAVTREGSVRDAERHIKDDRREISDPSDYVLGWSNEKKLQSVLREFASIEKSLNEMGSSIQDAEQRERLLTAQLNATDTFLAITAFSEIDFRGTQQQIQCLTEAKATLESSSEARKELKRQIDALSEEIAARNKSLDDLKARIAILLHEVQRETNRLEELRRHLASRPEQDLDLLASRLATLEIGVSPALARIEEAKRTAQNSIQGHVNRRSALITQASTEIQKRMTDFLGRFPHQRKELRDDVSYAADFVRLLEKLRNEELPAQRKRFEEFLGTNLVGNIATLNARLHQEEKAIHSRIGGVNAALRTIEFSAGNYIEIVIAPNRNEEIGLFKGQVAACLSRSIYPPPEERPRIFEQIRLLMHRFDTEESWMHRVTDVRNWLDFGVRVRSFSDDHEVEFFDKSGGKSGGQKARLAFAILAAAISAQYGLVDSIKSDGSFRLLVIDEVFARTDEEQSRLALELFKKLGLQLLIVSPFDAKARIVEDFVDTFHLATNPTSNNSHLRRATRAEYESLAPESSRYVTARAN